MLSFVFTTLVSLACLAVRRPDTFFDIYLPVLVKMSLITPAHERAFRRERAKRSRSPDAFFTSPPMVEIIAVKK